jgi:hypothetical protein
MADITISKQVRAMQLGFDNTTTGGKVADLGGVEQVQFRTSADCYIDFDQPCSASQSYQILAADTSPTVVQLTSGLINKVYALGKSGSGTLFILAIMG